MKKSVLGSMQLPQVLVLLIGLCIEFAVCFLALIGLSLFIREETLTFESVRLAMPVMHCLASFTGAYYVGKMSATKTAAWMLAGVMLYAVLNLCLACILYTSLTIGFFFHTAGVVVGAVVAFFLIMKSNKVLRRHQMKTKR